MIATAFFNSRQRKFAARHKTIAFGVLVPLLMGVCVACSQREYALLDLTPSSLAAPDGYYEDVAWLEPNLLVLDYSPTPDTHNVDTRLMILNTDSGEYSLLPDNKPSDCRETRYGRINRLPNGRLGYLWECIPHKGIARDFRLHEWEQAAQSDKELLRYPVPFWATAFSFAPGMNRWLQEQQGDGLNNNLHYVEPENGLTLLLADSFARAGWPAWLPDGRILFAGTPQLPDQETNLFSGLPGIQSGLRQPWNIYLTDLDSLLNDAVDADQILLAGIRGIRGPVASPDGSALAFLGTIDDHEGLWVYRLGTGELVRVWAGFGPFAWSPDGKEIMVLVREPDAESFRGRPALIKLPNSLVK